MESEYDVVVVGSGFGGGVTACRMAERGLRVCVLERGRRFGPGDFPDRPEQAPLAFWHPDLNPGGMLDLRLMRDLSVITAAGVGGGSLVYANVQLRAPADVFEATPWPVAITRAELDPYYDRTEEALDPHVTPAEPPLPKIRAFDDMAQRAGRTAERLPLAEHFGESRRHPFSGVHQQGCQNLGRCDLGCPVLAKNTVDITYLARAEAHGAEVYPLREVHRLDPPDGTGGRWRVGFRDLQYRVDGSVEAPLLVLAAGTVGTSRLLLKNRSRLRRLSPALGSRFSGNGDALALALDPAAPGVTGARTEYGPSMTSRIDYTAERGFMVADGGLPGNFGGILAAVREVNALTGWGRVVLQVKNAATRIGLTDSHVTHRNVKLKRQEPIGDSLVFLMIGRDAADGQMRLTPLLRCFDIRWSRADSAGLFAGMRDIAGELARAAQAKSFFALDAGPLGKFITVHPLGGCPMSDDAARGVTDDRGRVHGYDGLYVLDGSIVPTALGVNPSKTIAALAERGVEHLLADQGTVMAGFEVRQTWKNHLGNQQIDPLRIYDPGTIDEVSRIVRAAEDAGVTVRAVGSGHSWSDVALTRGFLLKPDGMSQPVAREPDFLRVDWAERKLVRAEAGIRIKELNAYLDGRGLALSNMGGYDHQTIAGVISTSTHGSGITFGPLNDFVRSLDIVSAGGMVYRVEPSDGPTDRAAYEAHHGGARTLVQDDQWFNAVAVSMGCMGVICTVMLEVEAKYYLREVREFHTWEKVRADLIDGEVLRANRHYEVLFSPYVRHHAYPCLITTRNYTSNPSRRPLDKRSRNWLVEAASAFPLTPHVINLIVDVKPSLSPQMMENAIRALVKNEYDEVSYKVLNIGAANLLPAYSAEIGVPMDGRHVEAAEAIIRVATEWQDLGEVYQSSPISFRFVKASPAYMSMMQGRDTMMIELIELSRCDGGYELIAAYEKELSKLGGRPHWGQVNTLTASQGLLEAMYPRYPDWLQVLGQLNSSGVFDSPFTERVGISAPRFTP